MGQPLVLIVAYRNTTALEAALSTLGGGRGVLIVDNGVDPDVLALAARHGADYLTPGRNIGFAAAVNLGLTRRAGRNVLLLNPDARIEPGGVGALSATLDADRSLCAVAPRLRGDDGVAQRVEWPIPSPTVEWLKALRLERLAPAGRSFLAGAVLVLRDEAIDDVGLFDERFFLYAEECDWQLRALRKGWKVRVVDEVTAIHSGAGSSDVETVRAGHFQESARLFGIKWYGRAGWASMRTASLCAAAVRLPFSVFDGDRRARYARQLRP